MSPRNSSNRKPSGPLLLLWTSLIVLVSACSPATISRLGPSLPPRKPNCEVEVLEPGKTPFHAHRDIGVVSLENCQQYHVNPCRKWLIDAVCKMGGQVAYLPNPEPPRNEFDPVNFRVLVAVYTIGGPGGEDDPPANVCKEPEPEDPAPERCME
jgi:hypothetical protein